VAYDNVVHENTPATNVSKTGAPVSVDALRGELRDAGLRATGARIAVLRIMRMAAAPLSHAEVCDRLEGQPWDKATVYRNLIDLAKAGLLRRAVLGGRVWRFEDVHEGDQGDHRHAHFVCVTCGSVECLPEGAVTVGVQDLPSGRPIEVQLRGECTDCGEATSP